MDTRADIEVETLRKIVPVLVIVWSAVEILESVRSGILGPLQPIFGLAIVVLVVRWLLDRI